MSSNNNPATIDADSYVIMFGGKGGVGKTTCAGAMALHHASQGDKTLIITTDPAPSLSHIFENKSEQKPAKVMENLYMSELGIEEVQGMWDRKFGREVYEVFSSFVSIGYQEFVEYVSVMMPGMREEFMVDYIKLLIDDREYDQVIWDTAPLGQTIGLLHTPTMLREHLKPAAKIYSRIKTTERSKRSVLNIIKGWEELSLEDVNFLRTRVKFVIVTIPEALAVQQLYGLIAEFKEHDFKIERLIVNNVVEEADSEFLRIKREQQQGYIQELHRRFGGIEMVEVPLSPQEIKGVERLREVERRLFG
ncbi:ArsA family ATPase [Chloroflexota bacterium]